MIFRIPAECSKGRYIINKVSTRTKWRNPKTLTFSAKQGFQKGPFKNRFRDGKEGNGWRSIEI